MFRPRIIPILLLQGHGLVKTTRFRNPRYLGDPINAVKIFNDLEADELVFLDITATLENRTIDLDTVRKIGDEAYMPFGVGGGIRTVAAGVALVHAGSEKIILNTLFHENPGMITELSKTLGNQSVVVSIDVDKNWLGKYSCFSRSATKKTGMSPEDAARKAEDLGAGEIILNSIAHDGAMLGYNLELIQKVVACVSIPVVASCGAGTILHMKEVVDHGAHAAAAGSLFVYHGARKAILVNYPSKAEMLKIWERG